MKALKDVKEVTLFESRDVFGDSVEFYWSIQNEFGLYGENCEKLETLESKSYVTKRGARGNWERFAKLNGIKNYKIIDKVI